MVKFSPPENVDFICAKQWPEWLQQFQGYRAATKLNLETGEVQVSTLLYPLGKEAEHVNNTFVISGGPFSDDGRTDQDCCASG